MAKKVQYFGDLKTCQPVPYKESAILKALKEDGQILVETKHDGVQLNIVVIPLSGGWEVHYMSRAGLEFDPLFMETPNLTRLIENFAKSAYNQHRTGFMIQGELYSDTLNAAQLSGQLASDKIGKISLNFAMFAVLPFDQVYERSEPIAINRMIQNQRAGITLWGLQQIATLYPHIKSENDHVRIALSVVKQVAVFKLLDDGDVKDGQTIPSLMGEYQLARSQGHEGVVAWRINQPWHRGKKTGGWKLKPSETHDGEVVGFIEGREESTAGKYVGFIVMLEDGTVTNADGLTDELIRDITDEPDQYVGAKVEVSCMERFPNGSLRHPKFLRFRGINDKSVKE